MLDELREDFADASFVPVDDLPEPQAEPDELPKDFSGAFLLYFDFL